MHLKANLIQSSMLLCGDSSPALVALKVHKALPFCVKMGHIVLSLLLRSKMCEWTQVHFRCGHLRYTVRAWCANYERTHRRYNMDCECIVALEYR